MTKFKKLLLTLLVTALFSVLFSLSGFAAKLEAPEIKEISSTENGITISWEKVEKAYAYRIYLQNSDGDFKSIKSLKGLSYTVENLKANKEYFFKIRAYTKNKEGKKSFGKYSEVFSQKTKLESIKAVNFENASETAIRISWSAVSDAETYRVYYKKNTEKKYSLYGKTKETWIRLENLNSKNSYAVKIIAKSKGNSSAYTKAIRFYTKPSSPAAPVLKSRDGSTITVQWEKTPFATKYYVYMCESKNGKYKKLGSTEETSFTCKVNSPKATRYIKIRAGVVNENQKSVSGYSDFLKAKTGNINITLPSTVRKGEYPDVKVNSYTSKVKWSSSDTSVIKVKNSGLFASGVGTATVTAEYKGFKAKAKIKVTAPVVNYMAAVYDVTNKGFVFENNINKRCYPASITKLITALVALKYMDLDDVVVVGNELNLVEALSSRCDIYRGEKFRLGDLLYGLLLPSGGDAAYTIAVNVARKVSGRQNMGYVEAKNYFVSLMNKYMKSIGATGTHCVNPHGYPVNNHYSTVHDLMLVAQRVLKNPTLKKITSTPYKYVTALTGRGRSWSTTNGLIASHSYWYSRYAHGMKTGTVNDTYTGIISAATKNNRTIITIVIGCESYNARYNATHKLYNAYLY